MKHFDAFSGYGGFRIPCKKYGIDTIGFSEIDKYAISVYKYHFDGVKNYGNISGINWESIPDFDLFTAGFPCQDLSISGKRKGLSGRRSGLFFEIIRAIEQKKPNYIILENVKGTFSNNRGRDLGIIFSELSEVGYDYQWQVLNSKDFGIPQNRERIFIVGNVRGIPRPEIFPIRKSNEGTNKIRENNEGQENIAWSLRSRDYKDGTNFVMVSNIYGGFGEDYAREHDICPTIRTPAGGGHIPMVKEQLLNEMIEKNECNCVTPDAYIASGKRKRDNEGKAVLTSMNERRIRKLTPLECERLMNLPDNWTRYGLDEKGNKYKLSDTQRYKLCGNGVVVAVVDEIIRRITNKKTISVKEDESNCIKQLNNWKKRGKKSFF